jgi:hypothetical protein
MGLLPAPDLLHVELVISLVPLRYLKQKPLGRVNILNLTPFFFIFFYFSPLDTDYEICAKSFDWLWSITLFGWGTVALNGVGYVR